MWLNFRSYEEVKIYVNETTNKSNQLSHFSHLAIMEYNKHEHESTDYDMTASCITFMLPGKVLAGKKYNVR